MNEPMNVNDRRRRLLAATAAATGVGILSFVTNARAGAAVSGTGASSAPASESLTDAIRAFSGGAPVTTGRVVLDVATLVDNGNTVPISVTVDSPMTAASHVTAIAVFNERNPQRDVARFTLGPRSGRAQVATRIRLSTSQKLVAVARMNDGTYWSHTADVVVTLAACIEGDA